MQKVAQSAQTASGRNRKKKLLVASAALAGFGLVAAGGYATLTSDALIRSGPFSSSKKPEGPDKLDLRVNGAKAVDLAGLSLTNMVVGDATSEQRAVLSNKGNVDADNVMLQTRIDKTKDAAALADVIDIVIANHDGLVPTTVTKSLAELVGKPMNLKEELKLRGLSAKEATTGELTFKAVMSKRANNQQHGDKRLNQIEFRLTAS